MFTSDYPLMSPVDRTEVFRLVWAVIDAKDHNSLERATDRLVGYICSHKIEFLDVLKRGVESHVRHDYWCFKNRDNGSFDPKHTVPYSFEDGRMLHPKEVYRYKWTDEKLQEMWRQLVDVPVDENENLDADFVVDGWVLFPKGFPQEDVWHWFDQRHSLGLYKLMGGNEGESAD